MLTKNNVLGVGITNETAENILEYILQRLRIAPKFYIVTPNPEILVYANKHPKYKNILNNAEVALPDGAGLFLASIFMAKPFRERIPGVDFLEMLCKSTVRNPISMGFLGGRREIARKAADCLKKKYPHLNIVFIAEEWSQDGFVKQESANKYKPASVDKLKQKTVHNPKLMLDNPEIDILFVAFGHPKQEEWIYENLNKIPVKAAMGVGGAFDYLSGEVKRAPLIVRAIGFEWLYRLIKEPWRLKRQLALIEFVKLVFKERF